MKRLTTLLVLAGCLAAAGVRAQEQELSGFSPDAKSLAMGGVAVTQFSASHTLYNNAAVTPFQPVRMQLSSSYCAPNGKDGYAVSGYYNIAPRHSVLAGWRQFRHARGIGDMMVDAAYAFRPGERWAAALTGRYTHLRRAQAPEDALAVDLSALYMMPFGASERNSLRIGAKLANLGGYLGDSAYELPVTLTAGAAVGSFITDAHGVTVAVDLDYAFGETAARGFGCSAGIEYNLMQLIQIRCGYHYGERSVDPDYVSVGAGMRFLHLRLDFAYLLAGRDTWRHNLWNLSFGFDF